MLVNPGDSFSNRNSDVAEDLRRTLLNEGETNGVLVLRAAHQIRRGCNLGLSTFRALSAPLTGSPAGIYGHAQAPGGALAER
jgi:hypothetical protein